MAVTTADSSSTVYRRFRAFNMKWRIPNFRAVAERTCAIRSPPFSAFRVGDLWNILYRNEEHLQRDGDRQKFVSLHLFLDRQERLQALNITASYSLQIARFDDKPWPSHHSPIQGVTFRSRINGFGNKHMVPLNDVLQNNEAFIQQDGSLYVFCDIDAFNVEKKLNLPSAVSPLALMIHRKKSELAAKQPPTLQERNIVLCHVVFCVQCSRPECVDMKTEITHVKKCSERSCIKCKDFRKLAEFHADRCNVGRCQAPFCTAIKAIKIGGRVPHL